MSSIEETPWIRVSVIGDEIDRREVGTILRMVREGGYRNDLTQEGTARRPSAQILILTRTPSAGEDRGMAADLSNDAGPMLLISPSRPAGRLQPDAWLEFPDPDESEPAAWPSLMSGIREWLRQLGSPSAGKPVSTAEGRQRAAIENLVGYVSTILDNGYLKRLVAELEADLTTTKEGLTESQIEARTFKALYEQMRHDNESLRLELSKRHPDKQHASGIVRALKVVGVGILASGFIGDFGAAVVERQVYGDSDQQELHDTLAELPAKCEQTVIVIESAGQTYTAGPIPPDPDDGVGKPSVAPSGDPAGRPPRARTLRIPEDTVLRDDYPASDPSDEARGR